MGKCNYYIHLHLKRSNSITIFRDGKTRNGDYNKSIFLRTLMFASVIYLHKMIRLLKILGDSYIWKNPQCLHSLYVLDTGWHRLHTHPHLNKKQASFHTDKRHIKHCKKNMVLRRSLPALLGDAFELALWYKFHNMSGRSTSFPYFCDIAVTVKLLFNSYPSLPSYASSTFQ